jgi:hypothetical protein
MNAPSLVGGLAASLAMLIAGCSKESAMEKAVAKQPPSVAVHLQRMRQTQEAQNDLRQIALFYQTFEGDMGHFPRSREEFVDYIRRDAPNLVKLLNDGTYNLIFTPRGLQRSDSVIAYEQEADVNGRHLVARADATVTLCSSKDLSNALKKK